MRSICAVLTLSLSLFTSAAQAFIHSINLVTSRSGDLIASTWLWQQATAFRMTLLSLALGLAMTSYASAVTTVDFGSSPVGPITNVEFANGDFAGTEYASLGVLFAAGPTDTLNIGCAVGVVGDPANCLGADDGNVDDFSGKVIVTFDLGGVPQVTDFVGIDYANSTSRTIIRNSGGSVLLDQAAGNVSFAAPGIATIEWQLVYDGVDTFSFGELTAVPEPSAALLLGFGLLGLRVLRLRS